eukprot:scaffold95399_cov31-Tisochrysis_lutea.AAC.4
MTVETAARHIFDEMRLRGGGRAYGSARPPQTAPARCIVATASIAVGSTNGTKAEVSSNCG